METPGRRRRLRWWPRSLYWRLALGFLAITTIGVAAADVYAARALAEGLRNRLDQQLASIRQDRLDELETSSDLEPAGATAVVLLTAPSAGSCSASPARWWSGPSSGCPVPTSTAWRPPGGRGRSARPRCGRSWRSELALGIAGRHGGSGIDCSVQMHLPPGT
ncbi:hypothetical protein OH779_33470 [Actinacidiphila glaucinigra]|uniref:hypothetical protein n=1 Tax=Actinacidiphila glaucinigra TaxID=235986 RepID=UPI00386E585D